MPDVLQTKKWCVRLDAPGVTRVDFTVRHGESWRFSAMFLNGCIPVEIPAGATCTLYWQSPDMGAAWYSKAAATDGTSVYADFDGECDTGSTEYSLFIRVDALNGVSYAAACHLKMLESPGFEPNTLPIPTLVLDFSKVTVLNAPYYTKSEAYAKSETYSQSEVDELLRGKASEGEVQDKADTIQVQAWLAEKQGNLTETQLANIAAVPNKADKSALPYKLGAGEIRNGHFYAEDRGGNILTVAWVPHSFDSWEIASGTSISGSWILNFDDTRGEWWLNIDGVDAGYVPECNGDETSLTFAWSYYDDAGGETVSGETTFSRAVTEYTQNVENVVIPAPCTDGGLRDLILRLTVDETDKPSGETTALYFLPADANETLIFETRDGDFPAIEEGTWLWSFSETDTHKFALRREPLKVATQPTRGGGN